MNKHNRLKLIGIFAIAATLLGAYFAGTSLADHFMYLSMDERRQKSENNLPENYINLKWGLNNTGTSLNWYPETSVAETTFSKAVANWTSTTSLPLLRSKKVDNEHEADVYVYYSQYCGEYLDGSIRFTDWHSDKDRGANYWKGASICLKAHIPVEIGRNYRISVAAHEIGHASGLHDMYGDRPSSLGRCNDSVKSIMDGSEKKTSSLAI